MIDKIGIKKVFNLEIKRLNNNIISIYYILNTYKFFSNPNNLLMIGIISFFFILLLDGKGFNPYKNDRNFYKQVMRNLKFIKL
jgi:hypothetical protein